MLYVDSTAARRNQTPFTRLLLIEMDNPTLESRLALLRDATAERLPHLMALNKRLFEELMTTMPEQARAVGDPIPTSI